MSPYLVRAVCFVMALTASITLATTFARAAAPAGVEFYLLEDPQMDFETARTKPLAELALRGKPWIAADNIERYDWSAHFVYLKKPVSVPMQAGRKHILLRGTPFVVVAAGERCYLGALWTPISSFLPHGSVAMIDSFGQELKRFPLSLHNVLRPGEAATDMRDNPRVKKALGDRGQFHAGLRVSLDAVRLENKGDTSAIVYTYTLRNDDEDSLYVLDPQRIAPAFFHDFQNGVTGRDVDNGTIFRWPNPRSGDPQPTPWNKLDPAWLTLLKKGEQMTRTVSMDAMPRIHAGKYECTFVIGSAGYANAEPQQPRLPDGRLWLGRITASRTVELSGK